MIETRYQGCSGPNNNGWLLQFSTVCDQNILQVEMSQTLLKTTDQCLSWIYWGHVFLLNDRLSSYWNSYYLKWFNMNNDMRMI